MPHMDPGISEILNEGLPEDELEEIEDAEAEEDAAVVTVGGDGPQG